MTEMLNRHDLMDAKILKSLAIIRELTNPRAHDIEDNLEDFLTAFRAFAQVTEWYVQRTTVKEESE